MKWLVLAGLVLEGAALGIARFSGRLRPAPVWLDVLFLFAAACAVAVAVSLIGSHLRSAAHDEAHRVDDAP